MTIPDTDRVEPSRVSDERTMLDQWLDYYRASLLHKCAGLTVDQVATRPFEPSAMSLAGLVRHMTNMERVYVHRRADPEVGLLYCTDESPDGDFDDAVGATVLADLRLFTEHCSRSREIMAVHQLDETFGTKQPYTLRWIYSYLIKEYARHLGHADLLRERIDGITGE